MKVIFLFGLYCFTSLPGTGQDSLRYVDFHIHTSMKNYYRDVPAPDSILEKHGAGFISNHNLSNWNGAKHYNEKEFKNYVDFSGFYGNKSYPEASWDMLARSPASILCTSITPIEKRFVSYKKVKVLGPIKFKLRVVNKLFVTKLDIKRQEVIHNSASFDEFMGEYKLMTLQNKYRLPGLRNVRLVKDSADLENARRNKEVALILSIEGAHAFFGKSTLYHEKAFAKDMGLSDSSDVKEIFSNVDSIKNLEHHVFFVTPSHMTWNAISGQAKSLDIKSPVLRFLLETNSKDKAFRGMIFKKYGSGIIKKIREYDRPESALKNDPCQCYDPVKSEQKAWGLEVINKLLDNSNGQHRIYIDMRHMDVSARREYIRIAKKDTVNHIPLIVSHAAVNGKSFDLAQKFGSCPFADRHAEVINPYRFYKKARRKGCLYSDFDIDSFVGRTGWFHPFSINLYNEEIEAVYKSDGIIGITLEERVLGTGRYNYSGKHYREMKKFIDARHELSNDDFKKLKIIEPFMRNLLYIVEHSGFKEQPESWNHIALGSDFDGMIDPLDVCSRVTDIPEFYNLLVRFLPDYAEFTGKKKLLMNQPVSLLLSKLFYENGERFIIKYFK